MSRSFENIVDFYTSIRKSAELTDLFIDFVSEYEQLLFGCKCTKKTRDKLMENLYRGIGDHLTQDRVNKMKEFFNCDEFSFQLDDEIFLSVK